MAGTLYRVGLGAYCAVAVVTSSAAIYLSRYGHERDTSWTDLVALATFWLAPGFVLLASTRWCRFRSLAGCFVVASAVIYLAVGALVWVDLARSPIPQLKGGLMFAVTIHLFNYLLLPPLVIAWVVGALRRFYGRNDSPVVSPSR